MESGGKGIGVLGCSSRMKYVLKLLLQINPNHNIVALHDIERNAVDSYKEEFGRNIPVYETSKDLVNGSDVEWIFVGSSDYLHKEYILDSFNAEKNVFSEKPLAVSVSECEEIKRIYDEKNLNFLISYPLRYSPHYNRIKKIIDEGKIGNIVSMEFNEILKFSHGAFIMSDWRRFVKFSGGYLLEKCCHDMDLANWMTGSIVKRVASFGGLNMFKPDNSYILERMEKENQRFPFNSEVNSEQKEKVIGSYKKWVLNPFTSKKDIVDNQVVIIEYLNGVRATFHTNCSSGLPERRMYICGTKGTIRADLFTGKVELKGIGSEETKIIIDEENKGGHGGGDPILIKELNRIMLGGKIHGIPINDAIKSTITCLGIDEAMNKGEVVDLVSLWKKFGFL